MEFFSAYRWRIQQPIIQFQRKTLMNVTTVIWQNTNGLTKKEMLLKMFNCMCFDYWNTLYDPKDNGGRKEYWSTALKHCNMIYIIIPYLSSPICLKAMVTQLLRGPKVYLRTTCKIQGITGKTSLANGTDIVVYHWCIMYCKIQPFNLRTIIIIFTFIGSILSANFPA